MNLGDIQEYVKTCISEHPQMQTVPVVMDDGTYPNIKEREDAINLRGVCVIIRRVDSDAVAQTAESGHSVLTLSIEVMVEYNKLVAKTPPNGIDVHPANVVQWVMEACAGKPTGADERLYIDAGQPFGNFENQDGLHRQKVYLQMPKLIVPV